LKIRRQNQCSSEEEMLAFVTDFFNVSRSYINYESCTWKHRPRLKVRYMKERKRAR